MPNFPHHISVGGGRSGMTLDLVGDRGIGRAGRVGKGGATPRRLFLCGLWPSRINIPSLYEGGFLHPICSFRQRGNSFKRREDGQDDLPPLSDTRDPVGDGVRTADHRGGDNISGDTDYQISVFRIW